MLDVYFDDKEIKSKNYYYCSSNFLNSSSSDLAYEKFDIDKSDLREQLKKSLSKYKSHFFYYFINDLYNHRYLAIFRMLFEIRDICEKHDIKKIRLHCARQKRSFFTNKGGEGKSLLFRHEMALTLFIEQYFGEMVEYTKPFDMKLKIFSNIRIEAIRALKISLILAKKLHYRRKAEIPQLESLFLVRSLASESSVKSFYDEANSTSKMLLRDISLNAIYSKSKDSSELYNFFSFREVLKSINSSFDLDSAAKKLPITCSGISVFDDFNFISRETYRTYPELISHMSLLKQFVTSSKATKVLSAEMQSAYSFAEEKACSDIDFYTIWMKGVAFHSEVDSLRGSGTIVQSKKEVDKGILLYPERSGQTLYFGDSSINSELDTKRSNINTVTIYTQPNQEDIYIPLIEKFIELKNRYHFILKVRQHPRDFKNLSEFDLILDESKDISTSLSETDLAVSHFSTCLAYAFAKGVPYISYCIDHNIHSKLSFMSPQICQIFDSLKAIDSIFQKEELFIKNYYQNRLNYIDKNQLRFNPEAFNDFLLTRGPIPLSESFKKLKAR